MPLLPRLDLKRDGNESPLIIGESVGVAIALQRCFRRSQTLEVSPDILGCIDADMVSLVDDHPNAITQQVDPLLGGQSVQEFEEEGMGCRIRLEALGAVELVPSQHPV